MELYTILGTAGTFIFGLLSIYLYFKSMRSKKPVFAYDHSVLQTRVHPEITILFNEEKIENLSRSHIVFFNNGNQEIRAEDIPSSRFPIIEFNDQTRILSHKLLKSSSGETSLEVKRRSKYSIEISFDYLNPKDGAVIEVLYETAPSTKGIPANFIAPIKGASSVVSYKYIRKPSRIDRIFFPLMVSFWFFIGFYSLGIYFLASQQSWILLIVGIATIAIGCGGFWGTIVVPLRRAVPKFAVEFFEN